MDNAARLAALAQATSRFGSELAQLAPETPVPSCPGWTVEDLALHLQDAYLWAVAALGTTQRPERPHTGHTDETTLVEGYNTAAKLLLERLRETPADAPAWTFFAGDRTTAFWIRRMLHETVMHLVDLGLAGQRIIGEGAEIDPEVADDGIEEFLEVLLGRFVLADPGILPLPLRLTTTDTGSRWTVQMAGGEYSVAPTADGDDAAVISGTAVQIYLALWDRLDRSVLHIDGEGPAARHFLASRIAP